MIRFNIFAAAAILAAIVASPASAQQAMDEPGMFAFYHPNGDLHIGSSRPPADAQARCRRGCSCSMQRQHVPRQCIAQTWGVSFVSTEV